MSDLSNIISVIVTGMSVIFAVMALVGAMRAGVLTRLRVGNIFELQATPQERQAAKALVEAARAGREEVPFETEQLALYYGRFWRNQRSASGSASSSHRLGSW